MVVPQGQSSHWDYFHLLGSFEDKTKFNYAVKLYILFLDDESEETREYILSRVIGALGALSNSMRAGAYSLFCTLLVNCPDKCDFETINKVISTIHKPSGSIKADAEAYVGQLLAYKALVQSGFLDQTPAHYDEIAEGLMELALKKSYLYAEGLNLLGHIVEKTKQEYGSEPFIRQLRQLNDSTLDKLSYLLKLDQNIEESEVLVHLFDGKRLLNSSTAPEIGILLAKCHNSSHPFLKEFLNLIADNHKYVSKLWKSYESHVKDKLDSNKNILDMYYALLSQILQEMVSKKQFSSIKALVSDLTVSTLLKHSKSKPELTRDVCKSISDVLIAAGDSSSTSRIINKLVFTPGNFSFDEITGSKLVGSILRTLVAEESKDFANKCLKAAVEGGGLKNKERVNALNLFCSLLHSPATASENQWRIEGLSALLEAGLLVKDNISAELSALIRKSFFSNISGKFESLPTYSAALKVLTKSLNKCVKKPLRIKVTNEMKVAWALSEEIRSTLEKQSLKKAKNKAVLDAIELLAGFIALKSVNEPKESQLNLADIKSVLQRITKSSEASQGPKWVEVLMDLFLNMLSKPNASNRMVIKMVFKSIVPYLNDSAFLQLVEVLDKSYDLNRGEIDEDDGQEGEDNEMDEKSEEESSEDSDDGKESEDEDTEEDEDDTEEDDDLDDEDMKSRAFNQEKLQFDLRKALMPPDSDTESINIDDMDEEQGKQLDATLSAIFRNAMVKKKPSKRDSVTSHFKARVLDLLGIYCSLGMPIHHWQILIPKVLDLAESCVAAKNSGGLKGRLLGFVGQISNSKMGGRSDEDFDVDQLVKLIELLVTRAAKASGTSLDLKVHLKLLIKFCIRNSHHVHPSNVAALKRPLADLGVATVTSFFSEKSALDLDLIMYLCESEWLGVHDSVQQVIHLAFAPTSTPHERASGITLLTKYFKNDRLFASLSDPEGKVVKKIASSLLEALISLQSETGLDVQTQYQLIQLISVIHDSKSSKFVKWSVWKVQLPQLLTVPQKQSFISHFHLLCKKLGLSPDQFPTPQNGSTPEKKKKKPEQLNPKKRKQNEVDARKLKKESKRRRLAAMDGLEGASWSQLTVDD